MSRLAKKPIAIRNGVTVTKNADTITVKGPKGELVRTFKPIIEIVVDDKEIALTPKNNDSFTRSLWGTYASHLINMMEGVTQGYSKKLEISGVGFKVALVGDRLEFALGFSHPVVMEVPKNIQATVEKNTITVTGIDKEAVGLFAAQIRSKKKPEPYKGKGIKYSGEEVRRKQGKKNA